MKNVLNALLVFMSVSVLEELYTVLRTVLENCVFS